MNHKRLECKWYQKKILINEYKMGGVWRDCDLTKKKVELKKKKKN
jgi:hypothetical protein